MFNEMLTSKRATLSAVLGAVLILVGLIGFVNDPVFGIFNVDALHNLVHILSGALLLLYGAKNFYTAKRAALILGGIYLIITLLGFLTVNDGSDKLLGLIEMNPADNWLHLLLTLVFLGLGLL